MRLFYVDLRQPCRCAYVSHYCVSHIYNSKIFFELIVTKNKMEDNSMEFAIILAILIIGGVMAWAYFAGGNDGKQRVLLALGVSGAFLIVFLICLFLGSLK